MEDGILKALNRADESYRQRAKPGSVEESVTALAEVSDGGEWFEVQWRLSRALFFLGQESKSIDEKRRLHGSAISAGGRAAALNPERVEGRFWLGVNLALFAECAGGIMGAFSLLRARRELQRAASISEDYHGAGPLRVLGRLYHKAPKFLGGSRKRGAEYFDRALEVAPANSVTLIYATELALDIGDRDRAVRMLEKIVQLQVSAEWEFENRRDREIARSLLEKLRKE